MSKEVLKSICTSAQKDSYSWALYFFKIDKRAKQPFKVNKVRFKNDTYLWQYAKNLLSTTETFQIDQISEVQDYDGENSKSYLQGYHKEKPPKRNWTAFFIPR